jgi:hypothetical protein
MVRAAKIELGDCSTYDPGSWSQCGYVTKLAKAMQGAGYGAVSSTENLAIGLRATWNSPGQMLTQVPGLYVEAQGSLDVLLAASPVLYGQIWNWIVTHAPGNIPKEAGMTEGARDERYRRISSIRCQACGNYAWDSHMEPVQVDGAWHHPACPIVRQPCPRCGKALRQP